MKTMRFCTTTQCEMVCSDAHQADRRGGIEEGNSSRWLNVVEKKKPSLTFGGKWELLLCLATIIKKG